MIIVVTNRRLSRAISELWDKIRRVFYTKSATDKKLKKIKAIALAGL